ncbi:MAG: 4-(cytidine 5'-diphospho)-2-C-methyl-D-erythritol kinase [Chryseolinea sp.]
MVAFPPCKINLGLHVVRKRTDGYHELETCFYPIPWTDVLEIIPAAETAFASSGIVIPGDPSSNLCLKAYRLLREDFEIPPIKIHLHKVIPTGAGLGGGSSDGAFTLRMLNAIFSLNIAEKRLMEYASVLGSDCAFFIQDQPMLGTGRGEVLIPSLFSLNGKYIVLINPNVHVSTADAFGGIVPAIPKHSLVTLLDNDISSWKDALKNDFESNVFRKHPRIGELKDVLYKSGALYASMTGSGSTVYGIFVSDPLLKPEVKKLVNWSGPL